MKPFNRASFWLPTGLVILAAVLRLYGLDWGLPQIYEEVLRAGPKHAVAAMLDGMALFKMGFSWGGFESLMVPTYPERARSATQWDAPGPSLRIHAGLEDVDDLIADLAAGLARFAAASGH